MGQAIVWFRRDLRLADNPALQAALDAGLVPVPVYVHAPSEEEPWEPGPASNAWLHRSLEAIDAELRRLGSRLVVRRGDSLGELQNLVEQTQAEAVFWNRLYEPQCIQRDAGIEQAFASRGLVVKSFNAALFTEPWTLATGAGDPYRVFTPFWRNAVAWVASQSPLPAPLTLPVPDPAISGVSIESLQLSPRLGWDAGFWESWQPGEAGAADLLDAFVEGAAHGYKEQRNLPDRTGTSKLSPHLHFGEISPRQVSARLLSVQKPAIPESDRTQYLAELGWREFSHHLLFHYPHTPQHNLSARFERFPWAQVDPQLLRKWQRGQTGVPLVDAGMRELWHTGWMHNRVRMVVASFLTKNLRYHWSYGASWFWHTLVDADLANNTQGWQWVAGTGADAAPYFRIFNPVTQAERFDPRGSYIRHWIPELAGLPAPALFAPWQHPDAAARLAPDYPASPIVDLGASREAALDAYQRSK